MDRATTVSSSGHRPPSDDTPGSPAKADEGVPLGHDLKRAIEGAWSATEHLEQYFVAGDSPGHHIAELRRALSLADHIIESLLYDSRTAAVEQPALDVNALITMLEPSVRQMLDPAITLSLQLGEPAGVVFANGDELAWLVGSLIDAAVHAMPASGELTISTGWLDHVSCTGLRNGQAPRPYIRVTIGDTGPGRSREAWQRATETRSAEFSTHTIQDSVSAVVGRMGGCLIFENASASGSRVHVCLPAGHVEIGEPDTTPDDAA